MNINLFNLILIYKKKFNIALVNFKNCGDEI